MVTIPDNILEILEILGFQESAYKGLELMTLSFKHLDNVSNLVMTVLFALLLSFPPPYQLFSM
jgi:hypothetical protein